MCRMRVKLLAKFLKKSIPHDDKCCNNIGKDQIKEKINKTKKDCFV